LLNRYEGTIGRSYARAFKQLQLLRTLRIRVQPNEPKRSLPIEPLCDHAPALQPIPSSKVDDRALPAPPPVLQIPSSPKCFPAAPLGDPVPARQISPPPADSCPTQ
jgi:hypothetical protein